MSKGYSAFPYRQWLMPFVAVVLLLVLYLGGAESPQYAIEPPVTDLGDGDTISETINTLVAQVEALDNRLGDVWTRFEAFAVSAQTQRAPEPVSHEQTLALLHERYAALTQRMGQMEAHTALLLARSSTPTFSQRQAVKIPVGDVAVQANRQPNVPPSYTVPAGTILFDAIALTALAGKIPINGALESPFPVKILVGEDNIAPGGRRIPELKGMVLGGTAVGDRTLRCVSVHLDSAHFVFEDGTIARAADRTVSSSERLDTSASIGWLSDAIGIPCLPGRLVSTAGIGVLTELARNAAVGYARARQQNEISEIASAQGHVLRALTGDANTFSRAAALSGALGGDGREQAASAPVEAVLVSPGKSVIAHISRQLELNYRPEGKRIVVRAQKRRRAYNRVYPD